MIQVRRILERRVCSKSSISNYSNPATIMRNDQFSARVAPALRKSSYQKNLGSQSIVSKWGRERFRLISCNYGESLPP